MEFVITKYSYYLPFKNNDEELEGIRREHLKLNGTFLGAMESPNQSTRELIEKINVNYENSTNEFYIYVASNEELKNLRFDENSKNINTTINLKATEKSLRIIGSIYLSRVSFDELKSLISVVPNSNSYFKFETIVYGDKIKNNLPIEIDFHSHTSGVEISFPIQQKTA